jgi:hypothetical protein
MNDLIRAFVVVVGDRSVAHIRAAYVTEDSVANAVNLLEFGAGLS